MRWQCNSTTPQLATCCGPQHNNGRTLASATPVLRTRDSEPAAARALLQSGPVQISWVISVGCLACCSFVCLLPALSNNTSMERFTWPPTA